MIGHVLFCVTITAVYAGGTYKPEAPPIVPLLDRQIMGGTAVDIKNYPYHLSLEYYEHHYCAATLISSQYAVTAAHCTGRPSIAYIIRGGSRVIGMGGENVTIGSFTRHPQYDGKTLDYDISIIRFTYPLPLGPNIQPVKLPKLDQEVAEGSLATVSAWSRLPGPLQTIEISTASSEHCKKIYGSDKITPRMLCAGHKEDGKEICQGDDGAPLVMDGVLIGIASWGNGCGKPNNPGVYSNVAVLRNFISNVTGIE